MDDAKMTLPILAGVAFSRWKTDLLLLQEIDDTCEPATTLSIVVHGSLLSQG
jgi:hypothetical protein